MQLDDYLNLPYTITLRRDDEGDWVARVDELKGCTAHGQTDVEALAQLEEAKRDWIQAALEDRIQIPLPEAEEELPSGKWVQRVPRSLHRDLRRLAKTDGVSFNQFVGMILSAYVGGRRASANAGHAIAYTSGPSELSSGCYIAGLNFGVARMRTVTAVGNTKVLPIWFESVREALKNG